jgi:osmotically-inducible protein OsmY
MRAEEEIARRVSEAIAEDTRVHPSGRPLWVEVSDQVVTLEGEVEDIASKRRAFALGATFPDVRGVVDHVSVRPAAHMEDGAIRDHIRDALLGEPAFDRCTLTVASDGHAEAVRDASTDAAGVIQALVHEGTVRLEGHVASLAHMRLAEMLAWWVPGTRDVRNRLVVSPAEDDNDDEISDAVRTALEKDRLVDAAQLRVVTRAGQVTLYGVLPSREQREIAERDAWFIPGVREVIDRVEVSAS